MNGRFGKYLSEHIFTQRIVYDTFACSRFGENAAVLINFVPVAQNLKCRRFQESYLENMFLQILPKADVEYSFAIVYQCFLVPYTESSFYISKKPHQTTYMSGAVPITKGFHETQATLTAYILFMHRHIRPTGL